MRTLADDLLDLRADAETMGKATGKDAGRGKGTLVSLHGPAWAERRLSELGISHNDVPKMAEDVAANDRLLPNNPREMTYDSIVAMYEEIL